MLLRDAYQTLAIIYPGTLASKSVNGNKLWYRPPCCHPPLLPGWVSLDTSKPQAITRGDKKAKRELIINRGGLLRPIRYQ